MSLNTTFKQKHIHHSIIIKIYISFHLFFCLCPNEVTKRSHKNYSLLYSFLKKKNKKKTPFYIQSELIVVQVGIELKKCLRSWGMTYKMTCHLHSRTPF